MRFRPSGILALGLLLSLAGCNLLPCKATQGGACSSDADCALAVCSDNGCNCGCGVAVARSRLGKDHPCLQAVGDTPACKPSGPVCKCAAGPCQTTRAVCASGQCVTRLGEPDGGP